MRPIPVYVGSAKVTVATHALDRRSSTAIAFVGETPNMLEVRTFFHVVSLVGMNQSQLELANAAPTERLVGLLDGEID
jgi:hypothetical protein